MAAPIPIPSLTFAAPKDFRATVGDNITGGVDFRAFNRGPDATTVAIAAGAAILGLIIWRRL